MKILVFTSSLRVGGAESMSIELANALAGAGDEVWLASADGELRDNVDPAVAWLRIGNPNRAPVQSAWRLSRHLRSIRPDVVHSHGATCAVVAFLASLGMNPHPKRVLTHHSRIFRRAPAWLGGAIMRATSDHFVAISTDKRESLQSLGIPPERISLIPNFVDVDAIAQRVDGLDRSATRAALGIPAHAAVVTIAGRVLPEKGFDRFVRIVDETAKLLAGSTGREVCGVALGDGPALEDVRKMADAAGAPARFTGYERDVIPWLAISDAILFPTRHPEVLPMFLIEASAAGIPAVCSDIPGNRDIVAHEQSGLLEGGADTDYARALARLLGDDDLRRRMGTRAREIARERFDQRRIAADLLDLYRHSASDNKL